MRFISARGSLLPIDLAWRTRMAIQSLDGGFTILDWTCLIVIAGCLQTMVVRLKRILTALHNKTKMMSPRIALHDPVFPRLSLHRSGLTRDRRRGPWFSSLGLEKRNRINLEDVLLVADHGPNRIAVVFAGRVPTIAGVTLLAIFAFKEFARASGLYRDWWMTGAVYAGIVTVGAASLMSHPRGQEPGTGWYGFFVAVPVFAIALILLIPILRNRARGELQRMSLAIVGFVYIGWMFGHLGFMANASNAYGFICYIVFATELSDVSCVYVWQIIRASSAAQRNQSWEDVGGRTRRTGGVPAAAVAVSVFVSLLRRVATHSDRLDRRDRRTTRRSLH